MRFSLLTIAFLLVAGFALPLSAEAQTCTSNSTYGSACTTASGGAGTCSFDDFGGATCISSTSEGPVNTGTTLKNPLKSGTSLSGFLNSILDFVIRIGTIAIILMLVFVGYKFVVAQGAPGKIEEAKKMLLWTVIGALILLGAKAISTAIQATVTALGG
ncbi:MAG: pilin [Minisyncoccia bacterium]